MVVYVYCTRPDHDRRCWSTRPISIGQVQSSMTSAHRQSFAGGEQRSWKFILRRRRHV